MSGQSVFRRWCRTDIRGLDTAGPLFDIGDFDIGDVGYWSRNVHHTKGGSILVWHIELT